MADPVPAGSDVSAGTSGGDSVNDPYPDRKQRESTRSNS
jgi:hypothetical protein